MSPPAPGQRNELHVWLCRIEIKGGNKRVSWFWPKKKRKKTMQNVKFKVCGIRCDERSHSLKAPVTPSPLSTPRPRESPVGQTVPCHRGGQEATAVGPAQGQPKVSSRAWRRVHASAGPGHPSADRVSLLSPAGNPMCPSSRLMGRSGFELAAWGGFSTEAAPAVKAAGHPSPLPWAA